MNTRGSGADIGARLAETWRPSGPATLSSREAAPRDQLPPWVTALAVGSALLVAIANVRGIAVGDDGVGYRAIADSLLAGDGLRYFLNDPLTIWPPLWPALMALISWITPLDPLWSAVLLNMATVAVLVVVGYGLLARTVVDRRLVAMGTLVMALGSGTIGFGHLLMTDLAFAVVVMVWMRSLIAYRYTHRMRWLMAAAATVWLGFGLRYVALYLLALGCLWLLFDLGRKFLERFKAAVAYGAVGFVVPVIWMLRNHALDGTFTGERSPSARGVLGNTFDIMVAMGRWLLPGVLETATFAWAALGTVVLLIAMWLGLRILTARKPHDGSDTYLHRMVAWIGSASGLLAVQAFGYLTYMLYVRSTTALNRLDLRLLNPAYFSLLALALVLVANLGRIGGDPGRRWERTGRIVVIVWATANVTLGVFAAGNFAAGNQFFDGNYESTKFQAVRENPALAAVPTGCVTYSNLPNALYPRLEASWSPARAALESNVPLPELDELADSLDDHDACLVWVDERPVFGNLWNREELARKINLEKLSEDGPVTVYRLTGR